MQTPPETEVAQLIAPASVEPPIPVLSASAPKKKGPKPRSNAPSQELRDLKDRYIEWMRATRFAKYTIQGASCDVEKFFRFLKQDNVLRIADVTPELMNRYSLWLRANARTEGDHKNLWNVVHQLNGIKRFFRWVTKSMIVLVDPSENLDLPRMVQSLPRVILTQDEARKLVDSPDLKSPVGYRDKALLEVLYSTGIRSGELLKLKVGDFDAKERTIMVRQGKGNKDRILPLPSVSAGYLAEYLEKIRPRFAKRRALRCGDDGLIFINYTGGRCILTDLAMIFKRATKAAGLDKKVTSMTLRHSIASHLLENGMDIRYIQEFLGHEKLTTTQIYTKVTLSGLRKHYNKHHPKEKRYQNRTI